MCLPDIAHTYRDTDFSRHHICIFLYVVIKSFLSHVSRISPEFHKLAITLPIDRTKGNSFY